MCEGVRSGHDHASSEALLPGEGGRGRRAHVSLTKGLPVPPSSIPLFPGLFIFLVSIFCDGHRKAALVNYLSAFQYRFGGQLDLSLQYWQRLHGRRLIGSSETPRLPDLSHVVR